MIFMTTNHIHKLDAALLRPGRVDVKHYIGNATPHQIKQMFLRFYEGNEDLAMQFVGSLVVPVSAAQLQGHFVFYKQNPQLALDNVSQLNESNS